MKTLEELLAPFAGLIEVLKMRYEDRPYHNWRHIETMLQLAWEYRHLINDIEVFIAMILFHDVIYDSRRNDNEVESANVARDMLRAMFSRDRLDNVVVGIEATAFHVVPVDVAELHARDIALLLDMDLAILGSDEVQFARFDAAVREEYGWVTDQNWREGRAKVMENFLRRPVIYLTEPMRNRFEALARRNIEALMKELGSQQAYLG